MGERRRNLIIAVAKKLLWDIDRMCPTICLQASLLAENDIAATRWQRIYPRIK